MLFLSIATAALTWGIWFRRGANLSDLVTRGADRRVLYLAPLVCALALYAILLLWSADDVKSDPIYLFYYQMLGAAWVGVASVFLPLFGISVRDDVLERRNRAAAWALGGALLAVTLCFAGGNVGNGPGWWVVLYCAALSTGALFLAWFVHERLTHVSESITLERDVASSLRLSGFLIALGIVLGRAVAGDWASAAATAADFVRTGWPALGLLVVAVLFDRMLRPSRETPRPAALTHGLVPLVLYVAVAIGWTWSIGRPA